MVEHLALARTEGRRGARGVRDVLRRLRCIQLDPLDPMGQNADLVVMARVDGVRRGDTYRHLLPGHAFEHFAKERCLLPASSFPQYREHAAETAWWRMRERRRKVSERTVTAVLAEIEARGALTAGELTDHGSVVPMDWHGWKGTGKATSLALEILWSRCEVVVSAREGRHKRYDLPPRALGDVASRAISESFARFALLERVAACGLLSRSAGVCWSTLGDVRTSELPDELVHEGLLTEVRIDGSNRRYLASPGFFGRCGPLDGRLRILGPLDPLIWDRKLVEHIFDFEYVWEVYKPAASRRWGWYVCPLLHRGELVARMEGRVEEGSLVVQRLWPEPRRSLDDVALRRALERHARACGVDRVLTP